MLVLAPAACCLAGLALSEVVSYLAASLAASNNAGAPAAVAGSKKSKSLAVTSGKGDAAGVQRAGAGC